MSHKPRSAVRKNRIMKLYIVNDMIGELYGRVISTMWKLSKKSLSPFWKNAHEVEKLSLLCLLIYAK